MLFMIALLLTFVIPIDANLDDPVFEPMFAMMLMITLVMVVYQSRLRFSR